ncbi:MAG TPA: hypothetical protein VGD87_14920, partial [Archangium sp.]
DRSHTSHVLGGAVTVGADALEVKGAAGAEAWFDDATRSASGACPSTAEFDRLDKLAQGAGGGLRTVKNTLRAGQKVWLVGTRSGSSFEASVVSNFDPRPWAKGRIAAIGALVAVNFAWVAVGTVLALWPPVFGHVSVLGAIVLIGHFLGMTPIAMAAREKSRTPAVAFLRGQWKRESISGALPTAS